MIVTNSKYIVLFLDKQIKCEQKASVHERFLLELEISDYINKQQITDAMQSFFLYFRKRINVKMV
ncbi:hypothetical protein EVA_05716 [gut metagenome]|uniref:Uncharacterized protein n=1 Tax=gut metagenome TaxID=749906 RepID=J9GFN0_9ZZZZ